MKQKIFMYLFFFALLFIIYQYVSSSRYFENEQHKMEVLSERNTKLEDSIQQLILKNISQQYFSLDNNDDALAYYDGRNIENPSRYIADKLLETNETKGNNPLVPYDGMSGSPMKINKIKLLNHKWIICDFSDGKYWGELLIEYQLQDNMDVTFTPLAHLLYSRS
ncbi:hydrolase [Robertkochia solimangrovi]|uniref:hydrolase n=1 Tax=Robertkochia solimangrovi TaxID=2213046 RepID=UPI00117D52AD|nr:hydrolase [Robertkochia solimangrovi]TRZ45343.1 hydrolase [Robertkochia solimangrovi]